LQDGYYWPTLHRDAQHYVSHCDECQRMGKITKRDEIPLQPQVSLEPFDKWGLDFVGPINPPSNQKNHILVCTNYLRKWVEVKAMRNTIEEKVPQFLHENIFSRFGVPREIVIDQGPPFTSSFIEHIMQLNKIHHINYATYHPQENG
jgi:hypothetical protein